MIECQNAGAGVRLMFMRFRTAGTNIIVNLVMVFQVDQWTCWGCRHWNRSSTSTRFDGCIGGTTVSY